MIKLKSPQDIEGLRVCGALSKEALRLTGEMVRPGISTWELDKFCEDFIRMHGGVPGFKGYGGFPGSACVSVNDEVIHGIPGDRVIHEGDLVKIDVGALFEGFHGDCAATFAVGEVSEEARRLMDVTRQSFYEGIKFARVGYRVSDISHAIQEYAESRGYGVVRQYVGHGVGHKLHEDPEVPNFGKPGHGPRLLPGMTIAIEPMINAGSFDVKVMPDNWTVKTADHSLSAHYEHSVLITTGDPVLLTKWDEGTVD